MKKKILEQINKIKQKFENSNTTTTINTNNIQKEKKRESKTTSGIDYLIEEFTKASEYQLSQEEIKTIDYYYQPSDERENSTIMVAVVAFHHKRGSIIEYLHPTKEEILKSHYEYFLSVLDENIIEKNNNKINNPEQVLEDILNQLTYFCLPDAVHNTNEDAQFFLIQNYKKLLYGISCYKQINTTSTIVDNENTRNCVQKAICIVSKLPLYGHYYSKLSPTISAFFNQDTLKDKQVNNK
jgi:hypothetical protein